MSHGACAARAPPPGRVRGSRGPRPGPPGRPAGARGARAEVGFARAMLSHLSATQGPRATVQSKILLVSPTISKHHGPCCTAIPHDAHTKVLVISRHPPSACRLLRMMKARRGSPQEPPPCAPGFVQVQEQSAAATWIVALRPLQPGVELGHRGSGRRSSRPVERSSKGRLQLRGWPCPGAAT